jgi:uncharacterized protein YndB with AHSA1/START domain
MDAIIDARPADALSLRLERRFAAPRELVFAAWTEPRHLKRWSAPHGFEIPRSGGELQVGGGWHATMRSVDGEEHRLVGTYCEIVPPQRLVFTHRWLDADGRPGPETLVTVTFEAVEGGTLMRFLQTGFANEWARDGHGGGWSEAFERLVDYLAEQP